MSKFQWSEIFTSIEGEGPYSGWPTTYIRFTKCNFQCRGFNNPENLEITNEVLGFDPKDIKVLKDIPSITRGCDSIYSWDDRFKHMWSEGNEDTLTEELMKFVPGNKWTNARTGQSNILSLTGGEPTLRWKHLPVLLNHPHLHDLKYLLIETNCSVPFKEQFVENLAMWINNRPELRRRVIWSNSPKLSVSGEAWNDAIRPEIARMQMSQGTKGFQQYFKFVCGPDERDFLEAEEAISQYREAGIEINNNVYIMPVSCTDEQQKEIASRVANMCIERGYIYCHRIHSSVFGNEVGT